VEVVASLSQGRTAAAQCGLFKYKSVPVIFEPPCISNRFRKLVRCALYYPGADYPICGLSVHDRK